MLTPVFQEPDRYTAPFPFSFNKAARRSRSAGVRAARIAARGSPFCSEGPSVQRGVQRAECDDATLERSGACDGRSSARHAGGRRFKSCIAHYPKCHAEHDLCTRRRSAERPESLSQNGTVPFWSDAEPLLMPRLTRKIPAYRLHKARNLAVVTLDGRNHYLGSYGSPESRKEYDRLVGEWLAADRHAPATLARGEDCLTVDALILRYWDFAEGYYVRDGRPARELDNIKDALRHLRRAYGATPAAAFGPVALKAVRTSMIDAGLARNTVNARVGKIRRMFKWAVADELVPPVVLQGLQAVAGLRAGRGGVKETRPVRPVTPEQVAAVLPFVTSPVRAMIQLQDLTGMRPGEVMSLRTVDVDRSMDVWVYRPARHKTQDQGFSRAIPIGPKAQAVLAEWLKESEPLAYLFSPADAVALRNAKAHRERKSPMTPSQAARKPKASPKRRPRDRYNKRTYHTAIERACDRAFPHPTLSEIDPEKLDDAQSAELTAWRKAHRWAPNQLRHAAATRIRSLFDLEAAQVVLGHAKADVTQIYAERDLGRAVEIMRQVG